jgi:two-component system, LytTR family, sensor kinase
VLVTTRKDVTLPSFWRLQLMGWGCFFILVLVVSLPYAKETGVLLDDVWFVASLFIASCILRPVCRSLVGRSLSWMALETRAFVWSALVGGIAAFVPELLSVGLRGVDWAAWLVSSLQYSVMLLLWCSLYFSIKHWRQSVEEKERLLRLEAEAREARLSALRYQLNPHFLFNSLNAVSTLVLDGNAPAATRMLSQIGDLLRTTLDGDAALEVPLSSELAFAEQYLAIEQTRLGQRLRVDIGISPDTLDALVPNMLLQPLVENAVRHGIAQIVDGGTISINSRINDGRLEIVVRNSGLPDGAGCEINSQHGIGLNNTVERLQMLYGANHQFSFDWPETEVCQVKIGLPLRERRGQGRSACRDS